MTATEECLDFSDQIETSRDVITLLSSELKSERAQANVALALTPSLLRDLRGNCELARSNPWQSGLPAVACHLERALDAASNLQHALIDYLGPDGSRFDFGQLNDRAALIAYELDMAAFHAAGVTIARRAAKESPRRARRRRISIRPAAGTAAPVPALSALSALRVMTWLLPAGDRSRYREELCGELYGLAEAGANRAAQLAYVLAQLNLVFELGDELRRLATRKVET